MHMKLKEFLKKNWNYIIVFLIPWFVVILNAWIRQTWFMGNGSMLCEDAKQQILPLFIELWNKMHSGQSLFFSWNAGNGVDFYTNFLYFLLSPFNLIVILLPQSWIENTIQFVMVLKWSIAGLTMTYYFMHTRYNNCAKYKKLVSGILGLAFVLSNFMIMQLEFFNWTDVIILFPVLLLQIENMVAEGKWKKYFIYLTIAMFCNFYMSYQLCIFLGIWFVLQFRRETEDKLKKAGIFIGSSVLSMLSSFIVILPAVFGAANRYETNTISENYRVFAKLKLNGIFDIGKQLYMYQKNLLDVTSYEPRIYFSIGFLVLSGLYFVISFQKKDKWKFLLLCIFLFVSCCSGALTIAWHGFSIPDNCYQRYLYMLIFLMLFMALQSIIHLSNVKYWQILVVAVFEGTIFVASFLNISEFQSVFGYLFTAVFFVLYLILLVLLAKKSIKINNCIIAFSLCILIELTTNAFVVLGDYKDTSLKDDNKKMEMLLGNIKLEHGERVDLLQTEENAGLYNNLPNTNMYLSYPNGKLTYLYNRLGLSYSSGTKCSARGTSPLLNVMFNIRYGISASDADYSDADVIAANDDIKLYQMNQLVGLGYMVNQDVISWNVDADVNYELQNSFVKAATNSENIFDILDLNASFRDSYLTYNCNEELKKRGFYSYEYSAKTIPDLEMTEFSFLATEDMDLYMVAFCEADTINAVFVDDKQICSDSIATNMANYHIGNVKKGQKITIYSKHDLEIGEQATVWFRFAKFNEDNYAKAYEILSKNVYQIETMDSTYVSGTIHADEDGIMMTSIPAMDGFTVYVDGQKTNFEKIGDALVGVPIKEGDHKVEFKYMTPYFKQGLIASLMGVLIFVTIYIVDNRKKKSEQE